MALYYRSRQAWRSATRIIYYDVRISKRYGLFSLGVAVEYGGIPGAVGDSPAAGARLRVYHLDRWRSRRGKCRAAVIVLAMSFFIAWRFVPKLYLFCTDRRCGTERLKKWFEDTTTGGSLAAGSRPVPRLGRVAPAPIPAPMEFARTSPLSASARVFIFMAVVAACSWAKSVAVAVASSHTGARGADAVAGGAPAVDCVDRRSTPACAESFAHATGSAWCVMPFVWCTLFAGCLRHYAR